MNQIINELTKEQKVALYAKDIYPQLVSAWKNGKRRPTYSQAVSLAAVTGANLKNLLVEIALEEARPEDKELFKNLVNN